MTEPSAMRVIFAESFDALMNPAVATTDMPMQNNPTTSHSFAATEIFDKNFTKILP